MKKIYLLFVMLTLALGIFAQSKGKNAMTLSLIHIFSGFLGMKTATYASARTANAARNSLNAGLRIAFRSGAVMGLVVVGLGLLDISGCGKCNRHL